MTRSTYTAISIGPIIGTFSQVRKPRHLWSASYIFSHLMKIIIQQGTELGGKLISPAKDDSEKSEIGLYPDRAFFEGEINIEALSNNVFAQLENDINISPNHLSNYFNLMATSIVSESEVDSIDKLNKELDVLELANRTEDSEARTEILKLIHSGTTSPLYKFAFDKGVFPINTLAEIATRQIKDNHLEKWENASKLDRLISESLSKEKRIFLSEEDNFYATLKFNEIELKSYHKYFCVVQADGDKMGDVIKNLQDDKLEDLSKSLIVFGKEASNKVKEFGGLPIYAGGDDLLFISPVVSDKGDIFTLIDGIDELYKDLVVGEKKYSTTMSYGISIDYYKYPLYEVWADARNLLFTDAKKERNSIACNLRKHSGSSFKLILNKNNSDIKTAFAELIATSTEDNLVSAVAHKLRDMSLLWQAVGTDDSRLEAFFEKFMGLGEKKDAHNTYLTRVKCLVSTILKNEKISNKLDQTIYAMLRIAKFINGEEAKDE